MARLLRNSYYVATTNLAVERSDMRYVQVVSFTVRHLYMITEAEGVFENYLPLVNFIF